MKWKELVFGEVVSFCNNIGSRTFSLQDFIKAKLEIFINAKPDNKHVEAKIRQQLQFLRDENKVTFLDNSGHYTLRDIYLLDLEKEETKTLDLTKEEPEKREYIVETYVRRVKWAEQAKEILGDRCLYKECPNTFTKDDGTKYIEVHHIIPLCKGGEDGLWNLSVLCAHHHKMAHYGNERARRDIESFLLNEVKRRI
ncbi:MAG TPA: HNH endonuclease [Candidatus Sumerlaeota bacterium]|nr:MAG: Dam-replacing family protein [candidate division BRC1 bacterium ADurb.Bin183]HOE63756.1 HNH endonuclease [Candidatus Sumerlaeota bacterium]HRR32381.1 HNH endonuclease [Candidatus Sumerlaeia bacterium]HON49479.1 HNH endonuclease [Candidatus Sumerlaeota bacterium]HOR64628.1 HNH endonuclease [Candidatus Sumerlaeota bacterium]